MRAPAALVLIAAILALAIVLRADLVIEESRFAGTYVAPLISAWPYTTPSYNDTSVLVTGLIVNARNSGPKAGAIAIHDSDWQSAFVLDHIYQMQKDGAAAVVLGTTYGASLRNGSHDLRPPLAPPCLIISSGCRARRVGASRAH